MIPSLKRATVLFALALAAAGCGSGDPEAAPQEIDPLLLPRRLTATAPATFRVRFETSEGDFVIEVNRAWAPIGADRFYNLVTHGFYDDTRVYRVLEGFMAQFGLNGDPRINVSWRNSIIVDDPVVQPNTRGRVAFAKGGPNSRTTELFISYRDNSALDEQGFAPIGEVVEGMDVVDRFHAAYGDGPPRGQGPYRAQVQGQGNAYLDAEYPNLTRILRTTVETGVP